MEANDEATLRIFTYNYRDRLEDVNDAPNKEVIYKDRRKLKVNLTASVGLYGRDTFNFRSKLPNRLRLNE